MQNLQIVVGSRDMRGSRMVRNTQALRDSLGHDPQVVLNSRAQIQHSPRVSRRRQFLLALLVGAVAFAFSVSPLAAAAAHAASNAVTVYKGQKIPVTYVDKQTGKILKVSVSLKSGKTKIISVKKVKKNKFTLVAKRVGKATLTASAKGYESKKYSVTVKKAYPVGSTKNPIKLGKKWKAIKSANGKKQLKAKATVWKGAAARSKILAIEGSPTDGTSAFDTYLWNNPDYTSGRTLYLIKVDYKAVKGYKGKNLSGLLGGGFYSKSWKQLKSQSDYRQYAVLGVPYTATGVTNGKPGTYYLALFVKNSVKELRSYYVGGIIDYQKLGPFGQNPDLPVTGSVSVKLG